MFQNIFQMVDIIKRFGVSQLFKIKFMSDVVAKHSRGYAISRIAGTMIEVGLIEEMKFKKNLDLASFAHRNGFDLETLAFLSDYFSILKIFKKDGGNYGLTHYGAKLFSSGQGALMLLYAYMPIFESLPEIIRKEKEYNKNVFRKGEFVGRGSCELAALLPFPYARDMLRRHHLRKILDLGCGAGDFLIYFCKEQEFFGVGIDLSSEAIAVGKKAVQKAGVGSRVSFQVGDIWKLGDLPHLARDFDVITAMFVIHEFLPEGLSRVASLLKKITETFPDKMILLCEIYRRTVPELIKHLSTIAEHHLFHQLSKQGLATVEEWHQIFLKAGLTCVEEKRFDVAAQAYFLLRGSSRT